MTQTYKEVVGEHAVELERRMIEAGVAFEASSRVEKFPDTPWKVKLSTPTHFVVVRDSSLARAIWRACEAIGLTKGLEP